MGVDEGNIEVMNGCRNYNGKLSNNYSYGVQMKECYLFSPCLFVFHTISYICDR